ncbi:hypothetical protein ACH5RR_038706 [Cinchona calisaya]|uniref:Agenet domain-containing protein n=1 Tax=Cinchona calisaya TaxID=153742 RepID=A0ABD2XXE9_9GENT
MDNDDNVYQDQGLHLVGEENTKVSPVLHPYALPKFDFDEGHLRFDSLVENEVFLGIPSQEDNQWIEDFSRGSSGIEFSSSAAESCSIPRHNNVWSEATSSESVEMLLKSVGQEEMIPGKSTVRKSDAGDDLPSLPRQMDDKLDKAENSNSELPPSEFVGKFSELNENPRLEDARGKSTPWVQEVGVSSYGSSGAVSEKSIIGVTEENFGIDIKSFDENQREICTSVNESLTDKMQEDPSISEVEVQHAECLTKNGTLTVGKLINQSVACDVHFESATGLTDYKSGDHIAQDGNSVVDDKQFSKSSAETRLTDVHSLPQVVSKAEVVEKCAAEVMTASDLEEPSRVPPVGNSDLLTEKGCNEEVCSLETIEGNNPSHVAFSEGMEIRLQFGSSSMLVQKSSETSQSSEGNVDECPVVVRDNKALVIPSEKEESDTQIFHEKSSLDNKKDDYLGSTGQMGIGSFAIATEASMVSETHFEYSKLGGHVIKHADDTALPVLTSNTVGEDCGVINESSKHENEDFSDAADVTPPSQAGMVDVASEVVSCKQLDVHDCVQGVPTQEKGAAEITSDSGVMGHDSAGSFDVGKVVGSARLAGIAEENAETAPVSKVVASVSTEKDSNRVVDGTEKISPNTVVDVPLLSDAATTEVVDHNMKQKSDQFEGKRGMQTGAPIDTGRLLLGEPANEPFQQYSHSVAKPVRPEGFAAEVVSEEANHSANVVLPETSTAATNAEQVVAERASVELLVYCHPNANKREGAEAAHSEKTDEPQTEKKHVAASSEVQGGSISSEIGKPSAISRSETNKQACINGGMVKNVLLSDSKEKNCGNDSSTPVPPQVNVASEEEKSFTFDVSTLAGLPEGGISKERQSVPHIQAHKISTVVDGSPSTFGSSQVDSILVQEISQGSQQTPDKGAPSQAVRGTSERKSRRGSAKSGKENTRKGNSLKERVPLKHSQRGNKLSASMSSTRSAQLKQLEVASVERSGAKQGLVLSVPGSSLPDLNTSSQVSVFFQQPFTDLQQVQLRAQIFVYGSLIQGVAPDEACMVSAFGMSDGGRSFWEPAWRAYLERHHGQKSHPSISETSRTGPKASVQANKQGLSQSKVLSTPSGRMSNKSTPSTVVNPMIPLSSPLWNISTPSCDAPVTNNVVRGRVLDYQALSPLHAYQTPPTRNFGVNTTWHPQSPFPGSWVSSTQSSAVDLNARFPAGPVTETVKSTPINESPVPVSSTRKPASSNPLAHDMKRVTGSHAQHSADPKSRKRKKTSASEDLGQIAVPVTQTGSAAPLINNDTSRKVHVVNNLGQGALVDQNHTQLVSAHAIPTHLSTSAAITTPSNFVFKSSSDKPPTAVPPVSSIDHPKGGDSLSDKRPLKPEDIAKVEDAKLQAEEASAHAAIAVTHCQNVWCQLEKHKNSGLTSDVEAKLASAAVEIAAAASIAKAAAAAAKIASNVALQAKLMADEASISNGIQNPTQIDLQSVPGFVTSLGNATPASILKAGDGNNGSSSIITAAREAAKKKIVAASAASRHAENLEAIVKAAELAAEAVSQAGKVVAMGDPLSISKLVEVGPEGYWKGTELPSGQGAKSKGVIGNKSSINSVEEVADVVLDHSVKEIHTRSVGTSPFPKETFKVIVHNHDKGSEGISASATLGEKNFGGKRRASDSRKTTDVPVSEIGSRSTANEIMTGTLNNNGIKESCLVEVFKDSGDFTGAWFSANVLSLKDGKALVCYTDLESDEGSGKLKEWIPLEAEGNKQPRIRLAHPMTSIKFEGTRKRRRAAVRDYAWSLNDRVDAWMENCWCEGVIIEKNKKDETTLSIHFPGQGKTSVVGAWHLRPTLVWKDGEWIEWANLDESLQGDTPREKRIKLGSPPVDGKGKGKMSKNMDFAESGKLHESMLLPLSANDNIFNIGSTKNENKPETLRTVRSGLQKEGSKVIFGVPKPGKKRKFMEVSKHYVSDRSIKNNAPNDSEKFAKYLMPRGPGTGTHGWKNSFKVDSKEKQTAEFNKPMGLKAGKRSHMAARRLPPRDNSVISSASASKGASLSDKLAKNSTSNDENDSGQQNLVEFVSSSNVEGAGEVPISSSSQAPSLAGPRSTKSERLKKGKPPPSGGKSAKVEAKGKPIPEAVEPRRSNRRIQPTSRLLEGLQSSLIISKVPSVSQDKSQRSNNRVVSKRE